MKPRFALIVCILAWASGTSCRTLSRWDLFGARHGPVSQKEAAQLLAKGRAYVTAGNPDKALRAIEPLLGKSEYAAEVRPILLDISRLRSQSGSSAPEPGKKGETKERKVAAPENEVLAKEGREAAREAERRIRRAETLLGRRQYREAQETLAPLLGSGIAKERVQKLAAEINRGRIQEAIDAARRRAHDRAIQEVESRAVIPESYGKTVRISRQLEPVELPPGPMEKLINKKVDMTLTNAGVREMVMALSKIEGMNIIADEALQEDKRLTVNVHGVPLKELLSYIARNMGIAFYVGANTIWVTASEDSAGGPQLETRIFKIRHGFIPILQGGGAAGGSRGGGRNRTGLGASGGNLQNAEDTELEDVLDAFLGDNPPEGAMYRIFPDRNLLVVRNTRENLRVVEELLKDFDQPPLQVLIEARFITISESDLKEIGFDVNNFTKIGSIGSAAMRVTKGTIKFADFKNAATGGNITLSGILGNHTYEAVLHLLEEKTSARTLSAPRVTVVNNHTARIRKGDVLYYFEEYDLESVDMGDQGTRTQLVPSGTPTELDLGITLTVKPSIGNDGRTIQLALRPEIIQFIKWLNFQTSSDNTSNTGSNTTSQQASDEPFGLVSLPKINENTVETSVVVNSGDTVVLGGMLEDKNNRTVRKVPVLGDIPYIGALFRHTEIENEPVHLLIFVTAKIIGSSGEFIEYAPDDAAGGAAATPTR